MSGKKRTQVSIGAGGIMATKKAIHDKRHQDIITSACFLLAKQWHEVSEDKAFSL
jgi:hypothetical protein